MPCSQSGLPSHRSETDAWKYQGWPPMEPWEAAGRKVAAVRKRVLGAGWRFSPGHIAGSWAETAAWHVPRCARPVSFTFPDGAAVLRALFQQTRSHVCPPDHQPPGRSVSVASGALQAELFPPMGQFLEDTVPECGACPWPAPVTTLHSPGKGQLPRTITPALGSCCRLQAGRT